MTKEELRRKYLAIRNNIKNRNEEESIINLIITSDIYKEAKTIAIYSSIGSEVDLSKLFSHAKKDGKRVLFPKVLDEKKMAFYEVNGLEELKIGDFGIKEPERAEEVTDIDVMYIPGIAFDIHLNRLGYGKGYYDYYLKENPCIKVGVCFSYGLMDEVIPTYESDIKMDYLITGEKILEQNKNNLVKVKTK